MKRLPGVMSSYFVKILITAPRGLDAARAGTSRLLHQTGATPVEVAPKAARHCPITGARQWGPP